MLAVPFENLDIHLGRPIVLSPPAFYEKIVRQRRGGFCYELNGALAWLLTGLGFQVSLLSARVFSEGRLSAEFDHLALLVADDEPWLADVGFGDSFVEPLRLAAGRESEQHGWLYGLVRGEGGWILRRRRAAGAWEPRYQFSMAPRRLDEFAPRCAYQQTSPESHFTQKPVCSLATEQGRVTLSGRSLIVTAGERREERRVASAAAYAEILARDFGMDIAGLDVARLLADCRET
jgi:N-hydroxyarylamine O-acetyltransferase